MFLFELAPPSPRGGNGYLCDGRLLLLVVVKKLKVVNWPVNVVQYCKHPGGGLKINDSLNVRPGNPYLNGGSTQLTSLY